MSMETKRRLDGHMTKEKRRRLDGQMTMEQRRRLDGHMSKEMTMEQKEDWTDTCLRNKKKTGRTHD